MILNLFVQFVPKVITESFTISIFTAVVLKLLIEVIARLEHRIRGWFDQREGRVWRALGVATMFSILFLSKFVVLEVIDIIFGDRASLGGFIEVVALVLIADPGASWGEMGLRPPGREGLDLSCYPLEPRSTALPTYT